jgi:rhodanese-related sulfurtransferase
MNEMRQKRKLIWFWIGLRALLVIAAAMLLYACSAGLKANPSSPAAVSSTAITPAQGYAKFQQGSFFLDVRTQTEWDQFHIKDSTLIPLEELQTRLNELPKSKDIVVVCLSGQLSQSGAAILQQAGFPHVSYVSGGLQAWMAAGYPVQNGIP